MSKEKGMLETIVDAQFDRNVQILVNHLRGKQGLTAFLVGLVESGKLEETFIKKLNEDQATPSRKDTFAETSKYMKQSGVTWMRQFLQNVSNTHQNHEALYKMPSTRVIDHVCIALRCDPDCWLFHKEQNTAMELSIQRYTDVGRPLSSLSPSDDIKKKGWYGVHANGTIVAYGAGTGGDGSLFWVDPPVAGTVNWIFEGNTNVQATLRHPNKDSFQMIPRFHAKYGAQFTLKKFAPIMSNMPDGVSCHPSLGDLRRSRASQKRYLDREKSLDADDVVPTCGSSGAAPAGVTSGTTPAPAAPTTADPPAGAGGGEAAEPAEEDAAEDPAEEEEADDGEDNGEE